MAHGCRIKAMQSGQDRASRKWSVRKRDGIWGVYPPGQCCPAATYWDHVFAMRRAHELAMGES